MESWNQLLQVGSCGMDETLLGQLEPSMPLQEAGLMVYSNVQGGEEPLNEATPSHPAF